MDDEEWAKAVKSGKLSKGDKLMAVDHSKIQCVGCFRSHLLYSIIESTKT